MFCFCILFYVQGIKHFRYNLFASLLTTKFNSLDRFLWCRVLGNFFGCIILWVFLLLLRLGFLWCSVLGSFFGSTTLWVCLLLFRLGFLWFRVLGSFLLCSILRIYLLFLRLRIFLRLLNEDWFLILRCLKCFMMLLIDKKIIDFIQIMLEKLIIFAQMHKMIKLYFRNLITMITFLIHLILKALLL